MWMFGLKINSIIVCLRHSCIHDAWACSEFDLMQQDCALKINDLSHWLNLTKPCNVGFLHGCRIFFPLYVIVCKVVQQLFYYWLVCHLFYKINFFIVRSIKCAKKVSFWEPKVMSSNVLLCPTNSPKLNLQWYKTEKQQILTFEELEPNNVWFFCCKNDEPINKIGTDYFYACWPFN